MSVQESAEEPRPYHLLLRTPGYRWQLAAFGILLATLSFLFFAPLIGQLIAAAVVAVDHEGPFDQALKDTIALEPVTWQGLLYLNLLLAGLVPACIGIVRLVHRVSGRWLMSVAPGVRWRFLGACFVVGLAVILVQLALGMLLPGDVNGIEGPANTVTSSLLVMALVVALTTPLQALGEEYLFRGYLVQAFGALLRRPWVVVVVTSLLFALAHGVQNLPLFLNRLSFGLVAGILVLRTGGLEAAIALHVLNNLFAFGLALGLGNIDETLHVENTSWWVLVVAIVQNGLYLVLILGLANRMGITSQTDRPVLLRASASV